jgi:hypothetical protein
VAAFLAGSHDPASDTLAEIYNWFTEGFDTAESSQGVAA